MITHRVQKMKHGRVPYTEHGMQLLEETREGVYAFSPQGDEWHIISQNRRFAGIHDAYLFFPTGEWYNCLHFYDKRQDGREVLYINLAAPYELEDGTLTYIDYDLDLICHPNDLVIDDIDEWQERKSAYPPEIVAKIEATYLDLIQRIIARKFAPLEKLRALHQHQMPHQS